MNTWIIEGDVAWTDVVHRNGTVDRIIIDADDVQLVRRMRWNVTKRQYAFAPAWRLRLHNLLMEPPDGLEVDHVNRNGLDNRRANLRLVTRAENMQNRAVMAAHPAVGVFRKSRPGNLPWGATISVRNRRRWIGSFKTQEEAAAATRAARRRLQPFAPPQPEGSCASTARAGGRANSEDPSVQ